jgi:tRNA(adenine34) deaminase
MGCSPIFNMKPVEIQMGEISCEYSDKDVLFMREALKQARRAYRIGEVPVGAVVVCDDKIIARGYNRKEKSFNPTKHAEITAIEKACRKVKNWRLTECTLYVTLEPCMMCLGAVLEARIKRVVYGAPDFRMGFLEYFQKNSPPYAYDVDATPGVLAEESSLLMKNFFRERR